MKAFSTPVLMGVDIGVQRVFIYYFLKEIAMKIFNTKENVPVAVIRDWGKVVTVCPVHEHTAMRTEMDPLVTVNFNSKLLGEYEEMVVMVTVVMTITKDVLTQEMGSIVEKDSVRVREQLQQFFSVCGKLAEIQINQAVDPEWEEDDDDISAITTGCYELLPVGGIAGGHTTIDELAAFQKETSDKLLRYQCVSL
ncbi:MAG: hypothetical protein WC279_11410 [Sulfurimonas sp.]|jgi:hypothetical protein|uniref:hypothetical protein n=1 Tax=Sulfurimonas sp. TaxID=2022749 RepID=UPI00356905FD